MRSASNPWPDSPPLTSLCYLSIHLSIHLLIHSTIHLSILPSVSLSINPTSYQSIQTDNRHIPLCTHIYTHMHMHTLASFPPLPSLFCLCPAQLSSGRGYILLGVWLVLNNTPSFLWSWNFVSHVYFCEYFHGENELSLTTSHLNSEAIIEFIACTLGLMTMLILLMKKPKMTRQLSLDIDLVMSKQYLSLPGLFPTVCSLVTCLRNWWSKNAAVFPNLLLKVHTSSKATGNIWLDFI